MRLVAKILSLIPLCLGLSLFSLGLARYRLAYENGRSFDARTETVYHLQTGESLVIVGIVGTPIGLAIALAAFRFGGRRKQPPVPR